MINKKKLSGGIALASLAFGGCSTPQEEFDDAVADWCRLSGSCSGASRAEVQECIDEGQEYGRSLSDDCLEGYAIVLSCYTDAIGSSCRDLTDAELFAACGSDFEEAATLCPSLDL